MRGWTFGLSIVAHLCFIAGVVVAPLFATDELPVPPRATEFMLVTALLPPEAPPVRRRVETRPVTNAAPLEAPPEVVPEAPPVPDTPVDPIPFGLESAAGGSGPGLPFGTEPTVIELTPPPPPREPPAPLRVGGLVRAPQKIKDAAPRYPAIAQAAGVQGRVILEAVISEEGAVRDVRVLRSEPLLDDAAVEAVRQWRFTPTLLNGQPVPVVMTVTVAFSLGR